MAIHLNKVLLVGRLGADPEERGSGSGPVVFSVATSESWKDKNSGEKREKTQWHNVTVWNDATKRFLMEYARKGDLVYVEGQLEHSSYEKDGVTMYKTEVVVKPFSGGVQIMSKDGKRDSSDDRDEAPKREERSSFTERTRATSAPSGRPGASRPGQASRPAFESGALDDDIPF